MTSKADNRKRKLNRLGKCDVCRSKDAIYTCPRCETVSCGLDCVKKHKKDLDCDGIRVRTKYVPKDKLDEGSLLSDYRLLEEIRRCVEVAERHTEALNTYPHTVPEVVSEKSFASAETKPGPSGQPVPDIGPVGKAEEGADHNKKKSRKGRKDDRDSKNANDGSTKVIDKTAALIAKSKRIIQEKAVSDPSAHKPKEALHSRLKKKMLRTIRQGGKRREQAFESLAKAALNRKVVLHFLPERFQRHWENTSYFFARENLIYWHIKLSFINANCYSLSLSECPESMLLETLIERCLKRSRNFHRKRKVSDPLASYRKLGMSKIAVLMAADNLPCSDRKFYELDLKKSIRENFEGKCIIEFPRFCVALQDCYAVSTVQQIASQNFFEEMLNSDDDGDGKDQKGPKSEFEEVLKKKAEKRKGRKKKTNEKQNDSDRESGELTDSSFFDSDSGESENELFKESEFRSIYKDLLKTFDSDVSKL